MPIYVDTRKGENIIFFTKQKTDKNINDNVDYKRKYMLKELRRAMNKTSS